MSHPTITQCVFLDSSNQLMSNISSIKPEFPPSIDLWELITKHVCADTCKNSRSPNAFMIYRKIFVETARRNGYHLPMRVVSSLASASWVKEPDAVKLEYRRLSKEASEIRCKMLPKSTRKKKKQKWNIISFNDPEGNNIKLDSKTKKEKSSKKKRMKTKPDKKIEPPPNEPENQIDVIDIPYDVPTPIVDLDSNLAFDNLNSSPPLPFIPSDHQQPQELNFENDFAFHQQEFNIEPDENNSINTVMVDFAADGYNGNSLGEFEFDSAGFLTFFDDIDMEFCYPSFWFEY